MARLKTYRQFQGDGVLQMVLGMRMTFFQDKVEYSILEGFDGLMGERTLRAEVEALLWAMECMKNLRQFQVTFTTDCSQLVKMVSEPEKRSAFVNYLEDIKALKESFLSSEIIHVPRTHNSMADNLARSVRKQPSFAVHRALDLVYRIRVSMNMFC